MADAGEGCAVLVPLRGRLRLHRVTDPEPDEPPLLFEIEIDVRVAVKADVAPAFFPRDDRTTLVSLEDVDLGVSDWRQLAGKEVVFPNDLEMDAAVYLATVHNPVKIRRVRFGAAEGRSIPAEIDLWFDFRCVKPRPLELPASLSMSWAVAFDVVPEDEED